MADKKSIKPSLSIKTKILILVSALFVMAVLSCFIFGLVIFNSDINFFLSYAVKTDIENFKYTKESDTVKLSSTLDVLLENGPIKKAFLERDREKLYRIASPIFQNLKTNYSITHWYFILPEPDSKCFLRVHDPTNYGDTINRHTYLDSVKTKSYGTGLELGQTAFALRVVHPYYDKGKLIGYMELGEEIDSFFQTLKQGTDNEFGLVILKKYLSRSGWHSVRQTQGLRDNWDDLKDLLIVDNTATNITLDLNVDFEKLPDAGVFLNNLTAGSKHYNLAVFPLYDAGNRKVGGIFAYTDITHLYNRLISLIIRMAVILSAVVILIAFVTYYILKSIGGEIGTFMDIFTKGASGDLTKRIELSTGDEVGMLSNEFNKFMGNLNEEISNVEKVSVRIKDVSDRAFLALVNSGANIDEIKANIQQIGGQTENSTTEVEELSSTLEEISRNISGIAKNMTRQSSSVEEQSGSIEEMARNIENTMKMSKQSNEISSSLNKVANDGGMLVKSTLSSIKEVSQFSQQILKLVDLITNIASQTNLLAMNAAIEATHAGEHGKGFSIVAGEIRKLSDDTNRNTKEIGNVVRNIIHKIEDSVDLAEKAGGGLDMIMDYSRQNSRVIEELMLAIAEQNNGSQEILKATQELVRITEEVQISMEEQKNATEEFSAALRDLRDFSLKSKDNVKTHIDNLTQLIGSLDQIKSIIEDNQNYANILHNLVEKFVLAKKEGLNLVQ